MILTTLWGQIIEHMIGLLFSFFYAVLRDPVELKAYLVPLTRTWFSVVKLMQTFSFLLCSSPFALL